jgi:hypothetical protein
MRFLWYRTYSIQTHYLVFKAPTHSLHSTFASKDNVHAMMLLQYHTEHKSWAKLTSIYCCYLLFPELIVKYKAEPIITSVDVGEIGYICCSTPVQKWSHASHNEFSMMSKTSHLSVSSHCRRTHMRIWEIYFH